MKKEKTFIHIAAAFSAYVGSFYRNELPFDASIRLKDIHSWRVAQEADDIARSLNLDDKLHTLASIAALLHDIGRFEQFLRYGTYSDQKSVDHAKLGIEILSHTDMLSDLSQRERTLVEQAVACHNRAVPPHSDDEEETLLAKLVRDADKLDIWSVAIAHYDGTCRLDAVSIGLPDTTTISDTVVDSILAKKLARFVDLKTLNDFKIMQVGWVYDLNFPRSCQIVKERCYLEKLKAVLPSSEKVQRVLEAAAAHIETFR